MSTVQELKKDLRQIKDDWKDLHPSVKLLDFITLISVGIFGVAFIVVYALDIPLIVTNVAFMIYPGILSGYTYTLRSKIAEDDTKIAEAKKEFFSNMTIITLIVLFTFAYASFFE